MSSNLILSIDSISKTKRSWHLTISPGRASCLWLKHKHGPLLPLRVLSTRSEFSLQTHFPSSNQITASLVTIVPFDNAKLLGESEKFFEVFCAVTGGGAIARRVWCENYPSRAFWSKSSGHLQAWDCQLNFPQHLRLESQTVKLATIFFLKKGFKECIGFNALQRKVNYKLFNSEKFLLIKWTWMELATQSPIARWRRQG